MTSFDDRHVDWLTVTDAVRAALEIGYRFVGYIGLFKDEIEPDATLSLPLKEAKIVGMANANALKACTGGYFAWRALMVVAVPRHRMVLQT